MKAGQRHRSKASDASSFADKVGGSEKSLWGSSGRRLVRAPRPRRSSLGAGVLGDGLGALGHGVLGELAGQQEAHGRLDLPGRDGGALVVMRQAGGLAGDALEDVVDEGVHDAHGLGRDARVGVHLLEHLVHVDGIALLSTALALLAILLLGFGDRFLGTLLGRGSGLGRLRHSGTHERRRGAGTLTQQQQDRGYRKRLGTYRGCMQMKALSTLYCDWRVFSGALAGGGGGGRGSCK